MGTNVTNLKLIKNLLAIPLTSIFLFFFLKKEHIIIQNGNITMVEEAFLKLRIYNLMSRVFLIKVLANCI